MKCLVQLLLLVLTISPLTLFGQVRAIVLPKGKKVVFKGQVSKGAERLYTFEAEKGRRLVVRLTSANKNAVFSVNDQGRIEYEPFETNKTQWAGQLPESENGIYSIAVTSRKGVARYTLEITLN